ncbi:MAG: preprotein translocase subunit SecA [Lentisphaerae bacterium]|jgi:preprotein translocase subunit SecA|nr:preprotein translocase subunit SecA [Lentisphaerota bacterium]
MQFIKALFGTKAQRDAKRMLPLVNRINAIEEEYQRLSDEALVAKTTEFRERLAKGQTLDDILCEAFAAVKNACRRLCGTSHMVNDHELVWDMIPFDVQLMGGIVLHQGKIAEMQTGEGKTLVATLPLYLNALTGKNVHLVTVNDYLARRDAEWMGVVLKYLGLTVGCIQNYMSPAQRREQYACDITYGTNSEFGFDYLRDNGMAMDPTQVVQNGYNYAIIDEVDSILIDEARTPLIISGQAQQASSHQYAELRPLVERLFKRQQELCNKIIAEAKKALDEEDHETAMWRLYQVYHGAPKHKQFLHLIEEPSVRKLHEQVENMMLTDMRKEQARQLREELFFTIDERSREVALTDKGCEAMNPSDPAMFLMPDLVSAMSELEGDKTISAVERNKRQQEIRADFMIRSERVRNVDQLLRAYSLYERDVEYVVQDNRVMIVDEFTGRILPGRRWSDGLHQAVEAKEGVQIESETQTLATITIQNYFRLYNKLAGMTGTAETEASEFNDIYKLDVVVIPTNRPIRRVDQNDLIYKTQREKYKAIIADVAERNRKGQPVLLGTVTVDTSEVLSRMLRMANITHNVLNAKNHEREAEIVALAGQPGAVTIATNMAGRGTDIKLGKGVVWTDNAIIKSQTTLDDKIKGENKTLRHLLEERPCGLHVIGSERHESRRIDRQLRGRCARQGDPGSSRFFISLEDQLMRLFGSDRIANIMTRLGMKEGEALEHRWLNRSVETAQRRVEEQNFSIRKRTLEYDDVMNKQREVIYDLRGEVLRAASSHEKILDIFNDIILTQCQGYLNSSKEAECRPGELAEALMTLFPIAVTTEELAVYVGKPDEAGAEVFNRVADAYEVKCSMEPPEALPFLERQVVLSCIDEQWQEYLRSMDDLRHNVSLRAYGQRDPLIEYKREAFQMFEELVEKIKSEVAQTVFRATASLANFERMRAAAVTRQQRTVHQSVSLLGAIESAAGQPQQPATAVPESAAASFEAAMQQMNTPPKPIIRNAPRVGRNDPCPCGSGKKYKKCCGA